MFILEVLCILVIALGTIYLFLSWWKSKKAYSGLVLTFIGILLLNLLILKP